jgi:RNA polymerase sigma factor (sigma-70 family)
VATPAVPSRQSYHHPEIADFAIQLRHTPPRLLGKQLSAVETLLSTVQPDREYPYEWVRYAITGYAGRGAAAADVVLPGRTLLEDLARLAWEFAQPTAEAGEPLYTLAEVAAKIGVAEKTIIRWRRRGLAARPWAYPDGRIRVAIRHSELHAFLENHAEHVAKAAGLTRLSAEETARIIALAREARAAGAATLYQVAREVSMKVGRALETVRYTVQKHDEANPTQAVFAELLAPLADGVKIDLFEQYKAGASVPALMEAAGRPAEVIEQAIAHGRALSAVAEEPEFIDNVEFRDAGAEGFIRGEVEELFATTVVELKRARVPAGTPPYLAHLYQVPLLTALQERALFRLYNHLKYRASRERAAVLKDPGDAAALERFTASMREAGETKNRILQANLRLVVSVAKVHAGPQTPLFELVSDGNMSLLRAIEKFDYARGTRFSTYAVYVISRDFARSLPEEAQWTARLASEFVGSAAEKPAPVAGDDEALLRRAASLLDDLLAQLPERERAVIEARFGLTGTDGPMSLEELGRRMGVTGERVRQIEKSALDKLRGWLARIKEE